MTNPIEKLFWSIALPGFGQILNGKYLKGIVFIVLEFLINVQSNFNEVILMSFQGDSKQAVFLVDYQWLMFYPCLYFFAMWDAFKDAGGGKGKYSYLPFVFSAYSVTVGCMYSSRVQLFDIFFGPVWFPMLCVIPGVLVGYITMKILLRMVPG